MELLRRFVKAGLPVAMHGVQISVALGAQSLGQLMLKDRYDTHCNGTVNQFKSFKSTVNRHRVDPGFGTSKGAHS